MSSDLLKSGLSFGASLPNSGEPLNPSPCVGPMHTGFLNESQVSAQHSICCKAPSDMLLFLPE